MIELTTFGAIELRRDRTDVRSVLSQPKRLALLAWLAVSAPGGFVARERLHALFWPESDEGRARNALRQALHFLRRSLGEGAVIGRGDREIGVDPALVACDAAAFAAAIDQDRWEVAAGLYRGEFMPGFHIDDAPEIERWIEDRRAEFARQAAAAAWKLSERDEARGEGAAAVLWARRALAMDPLAEAGARRLMGLLAAAGERASALEVYAELERRFAAELELQPSDETVRLASSIRMLTTVPDAELPPAPDNGPAPRDPPAAGTAGGTPPAALSPERATPAGPLAAGSGEPRQVASGTPAASRQATPARPGRRLPYVVSAIAAAALIAFAGFTLLRRTGASPASAATAPAIAVLPFLDLSGDGANVYFSDGITEEILNVLAQVPGLRVAARTSSFAFRDKAVPIDSIGRALNVSHILEGSVRSQGSRIRITAQLIEAASGFHIWSEAYDRQLDDIFIVQDEISAAIASKLQIELAGNFWGVNARETVDPEAYRMMLRALHVFRTPSPENYATSATLLGEALQRDPGFARAYGALANVVLWQAMFGWIPPETAYVRADSLARRGLAIAETPEAHVALARLAEVHAWNPDSADAHFLRALEINPSDARTLQYRALFLARSNRGDEAVAAARRATELDPLHPGSWSNYASVLSMLSREDEALAVMEKARSIAPRDIIVLTNLANQYGNVGRPDEALAVAEDALAIDSTNLNLRGLHVHLLFRAGRTADAIEELEDLEDRPEFPRFRLATLYANTQDIDRTLELLEESAARREDELTRIRAPDMFRGLRSHPRFTRLLRALETGGT